MEGGKTQADTRHAPGWRIGLSLLGIVLILLAICHVLLFFYGLQAYAQVSVRRQGGASDSWPADKRYSWSLDFSFTAANGKSYNGTTTRRGSDTAVLHENTVYYFSFAPSINALEQEAKPNAGQLVYVLAGLALLWGVNRKTNRQRPIKK